MQKTDILYHAYVSVLEQQLQPAMGCTEPIAIAYASALAAQALGCRPESARVLVSGNIIKNAKAVVVPNTNGRKGIAAACAAGIVAGNPERELQVLAGVTPDQRQEMEQYLAGNEIEVGEKPDARLFDIEVTVCADGHEATARIADRHTNVVEIVRDGVSSIHRELGPENRDGSPDEEMLDIADIYDFAESCDIEDVRAPIARQIQFNTAIAAEGIRGEWGANVGRVLLDSFGTADVRIRAKAMAAAGSDARMGGCEMPVVINSGSGNQGITVSIPVIEFAKDMNATEEKLYRALVLSNLIAIRQKTLIGCLSAYCGAISAGCAAGAGIAYLKGGSLDLINHTIVNSIAILSGTICDGAKPSCAAKIASAVDAALMGYQMALAGKEFRDGEGIVRKGVENTIANVGRLGREGMRQVDREILNIMMMK